VFDARFEPAAAPLSFGAIPSRAVIDSFVQSGRIFVVIGTGMLAVAAVLLVVGGVIFLRVL